MSAALGLLQGRSRQHRQVYLTPGGREQSIWLSIFLSDYRGFTHSVREGCHGVAVNGQQCCMGSPLHRCRSLKRYSHRSEHMNSQAQPYGMRRNATYVLCRRDLRVEIIILLDSALTWIFLMATGLNFNTRIAQSCKPGDRIYHDLTRPEQQRELHRERTEMLVNVSSILCLGYHESYAYCVQYAATSSRDLAPSPAPAVKSTSRPP